MSPELTSEVAHDKLVIARHQSRLAEVFLGHAFAGLTMITLREHGEDAAQELWRIQQEDHQRRHLVSGLKKLGIDRDPPAMAAAKYHYFSNILGGLEVQYIEESPKKVWIRYPAPIWTYPGLSMLALSGNFRRNVFASWHRTNGLVMGCPNLGWVTTKVIMDGEPYDEGYFQEYDREVDLSAGLVTEQVTRTPVFDPERAPRLNPTDWPEVRALKARRNYSREYFNTAIKSLNAIYGAREAARLLRLTMRCVAVQYVHEFRSLAGLEGNTVQDLTELFGALLRACGQQPVVEHRDAHRITLRVHPLRGLPSDPNDALGIALFAFYEASAQVLNGNIAVRRDPGGDATRPETWSMEDTGSWLW